MHAHTPAEIAQVIKPQFDDTDMETLTAIVKRYQEQDTWKDSLIFEKDSFLLLSDILESAGELSEKVPYEQLVTLQKKPQATDFDWIDLHLRVIIVPM